MDKYINSQVKYWHQQKEKIDTPEKKGRTFVTISREYGCGGFEVARKICEIMNKEHATEPQWAAYDRQLLDKLMEDLGLSSSLADTLTTSARSAMTNLIQTSFSEFPSQVAVYRKLAETVRTLCFNGNVVVVGRAGNVITRDMKNGYHVRMVAPMDWKITNIAEKVELSRREAEKLINDKTEEREGFIRNYVRFDPSDPHNYHLLINNGLHSAEEAARIVIEGLKRKGLIVS
jgi:cytidylate kinase